jgi:hypothetical protein
MVDYSYTSHQFSSSESKVQFANTLPMSNFNNYFASTTNSNIDDARYDAMIDMMLVRMLHRLVLVQMVLVMQIIILNVICKSHCQIICIL